MPGVQQVTGKRWLLICCYGFIYLFLVALGLRCGYRLSLAAASCGVPASRWWLLLSQPLGAQAAAVSAPGRWSASSVVVVHGLVALRQVGSSGTRARTHVSCIGRRILSLSHQGSPTPIAFIIVVWNHNLSLKMYLIYFEGCFTRLSHFYYNSITSK